MTDPDIEPAADDLRLVVEQSRVAIVGEIDAATAPQLKRALTESAPDAGGELVVDCSGLEFIDSSGLNEFVAAARRLGADGGRLVLEAPPAMTRRLLEISGLDQIVTIRQ